MNLFKSVIAGLALVSIAVPALAEPSTEATIIRIAGSTAFRAQTHSAIVATFDSLPLAGYAGSSLSGAGRSFFYGLINGEKVIITTSWSGSVGGVQQVAGGLTANFLDDTLADSTSTAGLVAAGANATLGKQIDSSAAFGSNSKVPEVAMSDTDQGATPFKTPLLYHKEVGVVGFKWITNRGIAPITLNADSNPGSPTLTLTSTAGLSAGMTVSSSKLPTALLKILSVDTATQVTLNGNASSGAGTSPGTAATTFASASPITNINSQVAQALYSNGTAKLSQFTGNAAHSSQLVYAGGRDPDSGTRLTAFAESGIGVDATVSQYKPVVSNGAITSIAFYPPITINTIPYVAGNSGESSGSTLAGYFGATSAAINGYLIGYVSSGDAATGINAGGKELTYNGVAYSDANIKEGLYTFWCYERILYPNNWTLAGAGTPEAKKRDVADAIADLIESTYAPIKIDDMNCSRTADGGVVFHD